MQVVTGPKADTVHAYSVAGSTSAKASQDSVPQTQASQNERGSKTPYGDTVTINGRELDRAAIQELNELKKRDQEVRTHEMAHIAAGGAYIRGGVHFEYKKGPDGRQYAVAGDVSIDTSEESDPRATLQKMRTVERAALAPAHPSAQDRRVAAQAAARAIEAMMEIVERAQEDSSGQKGSAQATDTVKAGRSVIDIYA